MEKNIKKVFDLRFIYAIVSVLFLIVAVAGSTYAYFLATISSDNNITGNTLDFDVDLEVKRVSKGDKGLIPIYDGSIDGHPSQLSTAAEEANDCIDKNGRTVCQIYEIKITNNAESEITLNTDLSLSGIENIKWATMSGRTTVGDTHLSSESNVDRETSLGNGESKTLYIMVYLNNTGENQTVSDGNKTFSGTVTVSASTGAYIQAQF